MSENTEFISGELSFTHLGEFQGVELLVEKTSSVSIIWCFVVRQTIRADRV